ncbi:MAG TPA: hypothetical protein VMI54_17420 [Polyangiaceae bacterium]|nr:hypothetical protein [Polyangiaceae bacterium]
MDAVRFGSLALVTLGLFACSVDDRRLEAAGAAASSFTGASGDGEGGEGNPGGTGSAPSDLVDGCADLDTDGVADCTVTLVENPSFTSDVDGWTPVGDAAWSWDPLNALDDTPSGSGKLTVDTPRGSAAQCVPLSVSGELVIAYTDVFVEAPDSGAMNQGDIGVTFFPSGDCSGTSSGSFDAPPSIALGQWVVVQAGGNPGIAIGSISVALTAIEAAGETQATVYFDNVMVRAKPL